MTGEEATGRVWCTVGTNLESLLIQMHTENTLFLIIPEHSILLNQGPRLCRHALRRFSGSAVLSHAGIGSLTLLQSHMLVHLLDIFLEVQLLSRSWPDKTDAEQGKRKVVSCKNSGTQGGWQLPWNHKLLKWLGRREGIVAVKTLISAKLDPVMLKNGHATMRRTLKRPFLWRNSDRLARVWGDRLECSHSSWGRSKTSNPLRCLLSCLLTLPKKPQSS